MQRPPTWVLLLAVVALLIPVVFGVWNRWTRKAALRAMLRFRARVDRFKLTGKRYIRDALLADEAVAVAARAHSPTAYEIATCPASA